jgi:hypothetical protein
MRVAEDRQCSARNDTGGINEEHSHTSP